MNGSILVVDDEVEMQATLVRYFTSEGFDVTAVADGQAMHKTLSRGSFDLVILDLGLHHESGLDLLRVLRDAHNIAVIILTGKSDPIDRTIGLELGADDYVTKPFFNRELLARVKAVTRRANYQSRDVRRPGSNAAKFILFEDWRIDLVARTLTTGGGQEVFLTTAELDILVELAQNAGEAITRDRLMQVAHHRTWSPVDRSVDVHVHKLRKKLTDASSHSDMIVTVRNMGYMLAAEATFE